MPDHAGFAAAVTIRERVLKTGLSSSYANGTFPKNLKADLPGGPPTVVTDLYLGPPGIDCEGSTNLLVLTLPAWGTLKVTLNAVEHTVQINATLVVTFVPRFTVIRPGPTEPVQDINSVGLNPNQEEIIVRTWTVSVLTAATPPAVVTSITDNAFKARLQQALRFAIAFKQFKLPTIDISFLGPLVRLSTSVEAKVRPGVLLFGLNIEEPDDPSKSIIGSINLLADFSRSNDVAGVVNAVAVIGLLDELRTRMTTEIEDAGATLSSFSVTPASGFFNVSGRASNSDGAVNFSFHLIPQMFHTRPGKYFRYLEKPRWVNSRTWAALVFRIEGVSTDVDRSAWTITKEIIFGTLTLGLGLLYAEAVISATAQSFSVKLKTAKPGAPRGRIQHTVPPPGGGMAVRISVDQFEITSQGTYTGITVRETPTPIVLIGPKLIPSTYSGDNIRYRVQLPASAFESDPALRVRWTVEDQTNNVILVDSDGPAAGRLLQHLRPSNHNTATNFGITARVYRRLGPTVTELGITTLNLQVRAPLPSGTYVRWRSGVKNPQIKLNEETDTWNYNGEATVERWSEWHRKDAPCRAVNAPNRYRYEFETADRLPFELRLLENHRKGLCPYCFYGGPAGVNASL